MDYKNIILNKYSVRDYKEKKVDAKIIKELSQYANTCPKLRTSNQLSQAARA